MVYRQLIRSVHPVLSPGHLEEMPCGTLDAKQHASEHKPDKPECSAASSPHPVERGDVAEREPAVPLTATIEPNIVDELEGDDPLRTTPPHQ
eukprot:2572154-Amphidinium_carterae.1